MQEAEYKALVKAQEAAIAALTEGAPMGAAQTAAIDALKVGLAPCRHPFGCVPEPYLAMGRDRASFAIARPENL